MENKFNKITGFFANKSGKGHSVGVTAEIVEALAGIQPGDRIFLNGLDSDRPFISYAKSDPAFAAKTAQAVGATASNGTATAKKAARVEKF